MSLQVFKQTTYEGCLPICLLSMADIQIDREKEVSLIQNAIPKCKESYAFSMILSFVEQYDIPVNLYVDDRYYSNYLKKVNDRNKITIFHQPINEDFMHNQTSPFILYVDMYDFGAYIHNPHFIIVEKQQGNTFIVVDSLTGKRMTFEKTKILSSVSSLKNRFLYSPLLITLEGNNYE
jgi:hypothetical protein